MTKVIGYTVQYLPDMSFYKPFLLTLIWSDGWQQMVEVTFATESEAVAYAVRKGAQ
jgi:hypothetical protein